MFKCLKNEILYSNTKFQLGYVEIFHSLLLIPLKKGTFWKVTKDTIDTKNEEFFSCAKSRSKSLNPHLCIKKRNIMHLLKQERLEQKEIKKWIEASILVVRDVSPTHNIQKLNWHLEYGRIILTGNLVRTWTKNTHITTWWPLGRCGRTHGGH
jgi:hypothetical protein